MMKTSKKNSKNKEIKYGKKKSFNLSSNDKKRINAFIKETKQKILPYIKLYKRDLNNILLPYFESNKVIKNQESESSGALAPITTNSRNDHKANDYSPKIFFPIDDPFKLYEAGIFSGFRVNSIHGTDNSKGDGECDTIENIHEKIKDNDERIIKINVKMERIYALEEVTNPETGEKGYYNHKTGEFVRE